MKQKTNRKTLINQVNRYTIGVVTQEGKQIFINAGEFFTNVLNNLAKKDNVINISYYKN